MIFNNIEGMGFAARLIGNQKVSFSRPINAYDYVLNANSFAVRERNKSVLKIFEREIHQTPSQNGDGREWSAGIFI
jgi:hypothetical protein